MSFKMVSFSFCSTLNITNTVLIQQSCNLNCDFGLRKCQRRKQLTRRFDEPRWQLSPGLLRSGNGKKMKKEPQHPSGIEPSTYHLFCSRWVSSTASQHPVPMLQSTWSVHWRRNDFFIFQHNNNHLMAARWQIRLERRDKRSPTNCPQEFRKKISPALL